MKYIVATAKTISVLACLCLLPTMGLGQTPDFVALTKQLKPAVVNITSLKNSPNTDDLDQSSNHRNFIDNFFQTFLGSKNTEFLGSGFIISPDGYILTNDHVVDNASTVKVQLVGGNSYPAVVLGVDKKLDLALLKIDTQEILPMVTLGNSAELEIGEWVMAIGNPFGLEQTVTVGIVSAKGRVIGSAPYANFIQTDASINPGNSGGPLFNTRGEVVGINTAIVAGGQGIGFAIPIDTAKSIIPQLKQTGHVTRGWLGITIQQVSDELAASFNLATTAGALITSITKNSPAAHAQLQRGDIILNFNGVKVASISDLPQLLNAVSVGDKVSISIFRNGIISNYTIKLEQQNPQDSPPKFTPPSNQLGATLIDLTATVKQRLGIKANSGVVITAIDAQGLAKEAKLQPADVILEYNDEQVTNIDQLQFLLRQTTKNNVQRVLIQRDEGLFFATFRLPRH